MKGKLRKISSIALSVVLAVSMLSMTAFANEQVSRSSASPKNSKTGMNAHDFATEKAIVAPDMRRSNTMSRSSGTYDAYQGTLGYAGDYQYLFPIYLNYGEILHAQLDSPNSSALDYNLYLYEVDDNFNMTLVDWCEYPTYINGSAGTIPEAVGTVNVDSSPKMYAIFVESYIGGSINQPFVLHVATNSLSDFGREVDESALDALTLTLLTNGDTTDIRQRDTLADNDWVKFVVPSNFGYSKLTVTADEAPLEVYTKGSNGEMILVATSGNKFDVTRGTYYYIRVHTAGIISSLSNQNYTITISYDTTSPFSPTVTSVVINSSGFSGGTANITYNQGPRYRINTGVTLTVTGTAYNGSTPVANATIDVYIQNVDWMSSININSGSAITDSNGNFTAKIKAPSAAGTNNTIIITNPTIVHYYDEGIVYAQSGNVSSSDEDIYIYSHSVYY